MNFITVNFNGTPCKSYVSLYDAISDIQRLGYALKYVGDMWVADGDIIVTFT